MGLGQNDDPGSEPNTVHRDPFSPYCHKVRAGEQGVLAVILTTRQGDRFEVLLGVRQNVSRGAIMPTFTAKNVVFERDCRKTGLNFDSKW